MVKTDKMLHKIFNKKLKIDCFPKNIIYKVNGSGHIIDKAMGIMILYNIR